MDEMEFVDRSSSSSVAPEDNDVVLRAPSQTAWIKSEESRAYLFKLFTCLYALFLLISGVVIEVSKIIDKGAEEQPKTTLKDLILELWLFGGGVVFIVYCAVTVYIHHIQILNQRKSLRTSAHFLSLMEPEVLTNSYTGSMYLRIGCIIFGLMGCVYYGLLVISCNYGGLGDSRCNTKADIINVIAGVFVFVQMWFVFCNGKIIFTGQGNIARFGLMHLCGTNLYMWFRYVLYEEEETYHKIEHAGTKHHTGATEHFTNVTECDGLLCKFPAFKEIMYTCVVEYSLICAGVAFVFWTNIEHCRKDQLEHRMKKRSTIKIDCSRTSEGLFAGLACIILTIVVVAIFVTVDKFTAVFDGTNLFLFMFSTFICAIAFWRTRWLKFSLIDEEEEDDSAELLDRILLVIGLFGELFYGIAMILAYINSSNEKKLGVPLVLFLTNVFRLIQVSLQSGLIIICGKLHLDENNPHMLRYKPGKQIITLLLLLNCAQFIMNVGEAQKDDIAGMLEFYGSYYWAMVARGCSPLLIFYRFHSSACFAEIWKKTYRPQKRKHNLDRTRL